MRGVYAERGVVAAGTGTMCAAGSAHVQLASHRLYRRVRRARSRHRLLRCHRLQLQLLESLRALTFERLDLGSEQLYLTQRGLCRAEGEVRSAYMWEGAAKRAGQGRAGVARCGDARLQSRLEMLCTGSASADPPSRTKRDHHRRRAKRRVRARGKGGEHARAENMRGSGTRRDRRRVCSYWDPGRSARDPERSARDPVTCARDPAIRQGSCDMRQGSCEIRQGSRG